MTTLTQLPDVGRTLAISKLTDDLADRADRNTLRGMGIVLLLGVNKNKEQVLNIIRSEIQEYPDQMEQIIGEDLVKRIRQLE